MPISARSISSPDTFRAGVRVRGGRKLALFLARAGDPEVTDTARAIAVERVLRDGLVPALRSIVPVRTGALKRSLRIRRRGKHLVIRMAFYFRWQVVGLTKQSIEEWAIDWINSNREHLREQISLEIRRALLEGT